jgi:hypothetical protein
VHGNPRDRVNLRCGFLHMNDLETDRLQDRPVSPRWIVAAVVTASLLYLGGSLARGTPPGAGDTGEQLVAWFHEHQNGVRWYVWSITVSLPLMALVYAQLRRLLPSPHRDMYFIGAAALFVTTSVQAWAWGGLALHADRMEPVTARTVLDVVIFWGPVLTAATVTMMTPVTLLALRGQAGLPRWLGAVGLIALVEQAVETSTIFGSAGFTEPGGAMNLQLGAVLVGVWMLAFALWSALRGQGNDSVA